MPKTQLRSGVVGPGVCYTSRSASTADLSTATSHLCLPNLHSTSRRHDTMNFPSGSGTRSGSGRSHVHRGNDDSVSIGRTRDYMRAFKACESCRRKKTRCILDAPDGAPAACRKCKRERKPCSLSQQPTSSTGVMDGPLTDAHGSYQGDDKIGTSVSEQPSRLRA